MTAYHIADEPLETSLSAYVVRPQVPLAAAMFAGAWLAWPWFAFNAIAMGSPTRKKEVALCAGAFAGTLVLAVVLVALVRTGVITSSLWWRLGLTAIVAFKLTMSYYISTVQERTFHVYQYYGGKLTSGRVALIGGYLAREIVLGLVAGPVWAIIVSGAI